MLGEENVLLASNKYGLVVGECVRDVVQIVPKYRRFSTEALYENENRVKRISLHENANWEREQFYVGHLYSSSFYEFGVHETSAFSWTFVVLEEGKSANCFGRILFMNHGF